MLLQIETQQVTEVAKGIGDLGMMAMTSAFFLVLAAIMMIALFKWFRKMIDGLLTENSKVVRELLEETKNQNATLSDISEALKPDTIVRIKNLSKAEFDKSCAEAKILVWKVRSQNHLYDKEATAKKIVTLLENIYEDRISRLDYFKWKDKTLSYYCRRDWIDWVRDVVTTEIYRDEFSEALTDTNVEAVYSRIKIDFYHNLDK